MNQLVGSCWQVCKNSWSNRIFLKRRQVLHKWSDTCDLPHILAATARTTCCWNSGRCRQCRWARNRLVSCSASWIIIDLHHVARCFVCQKLSTLKFPTTITVALKALIGINLLLLTIVFAANTTSTWFSFGRIFALALLLLGIVPLWLLFSFALHFAFALTFVAIFPMSALSSTFPLYSINFHRHCTTRRCSYWPHQVHHVLWQCST